MLNSPYRSSNRARLAEASPEGSGLGVLIIFGVVTWLLVNSFYPPHPSPLDWGGGGFSGSGHPSSSGGRRR